MPEDNNEAADFIEEIEEAGTSSYALQQLVGKADIVKKFVEGEAPVPWSETPRGKEWTKEWNDVNFVL